MCVYKCENAMLTQMCVPYTFSVLRFGFGFPVLYAMCKKVAVWEQFFSAFLKRVTQWEVLRFILFVWSDSTFLDVWFFNCAVEAAGGKALPCIVNVREEQQIINAVEKAVKTFGGMLRCGGDLNRQIVQTKREKNLLPYSYFLSYMLMWNGLF